MRSCVPIAVFLFLVLAVPHEVSANASPSDAQLHATKPAVAHELIRQQHKQAPKQHGKADLCRDRK